MAQNMPLKKSFFFLEYSHLSLRKRPPLVGFDVVYILLLKGRTVAVVRKTWHELAEVAMFALLTDKSKDDREKEVLEGTGAWARGGGGGGEKGRDGRKEMMGKERWEREEIGGVVHTKKK